MAIRGISVAYCVVGGLIFYAGIKGATMADTAKAVLTGDLTLKNTQAIDIKNASSTPSSTPDPSGVSIGKAPAGAGAAMMKFALAQRGKPYHAINPGRFGPDFYDCSGLIWAAATHAGLNMPGGPSDPANAIVDPELIWLGKLPGSKVITTAHDIQAGDVVGFIGADAPGGTITVGNAKVAGMGHIGIAVNPMQYMSAYDTAEGCLIKPLAGDSFIVGVRLP